MGLLDRGRSKRTLSEGVEGTAKIVGLEQHNRTGKRNDGDAWWWEEAHDAVAKSIYLLDLEVTVPGREPYVVSGKFKAPGKAERTGLVRTSLSVGLELPVRVDPGDPNRVEVDWNRFAASPDRKRTLVDGRVSRQNKAVKKKLDANPKQQSKMWANNKMAAGAWVGAVKAGNMSREEFEREVQLEVDSGRMDPADAEAARKALDD